MMIMTDNIRGRKAILLELFNQKETLYKIKKLWNKVVGKREEVQLVQLVTLIKHLAGLSATNAAYKCNKIL